VSFMKDPLLAVWGARNILAEARASSNALEISQKLAETEAIMFRLLLDLVRLTKKTGPHKLISWQLISEHVLQLSEHDTMPIPLLDWPTAVVSLMLVPAILCTY
jgi:hypothetical protein